MRKNNVLSANKQSNKMQTAISVAFSYLHQWLPNATKTAVCILFDHLLVLKMLFFLIIICTKLCLTIRNSVICLYYYWYSIALLYNILYFIYLFKYIVFECLSKHSKGGRLSQIASDQGHFSVFFHTCAHMLWKKKKKCYISDLVSSMFVSIQWCECSEYSFVLF